MPLISFNCPTHGEFKKLLSKRSNSPEPCPICGIFVKAANRVPISKVRVSVEKDEGVIPIMREDELHVRMAGAAEEARKLEREARERRAIAREGLTPEEKARQASEIEYREKVESVIKSEPDEELDKKGLRVWRKEAEHLERIEKSRGRAQRKEDLNNS